ncbi:MAG TPA: alpha/beta hydrolase [Alloacidobacterium sp.]|nr:alpha/beta hydrolase [Alloacidobacterium sp.]
MPKKSSTSTKPTPKQARAAGWKDPLQPQQPLVSGKWLLSALGTVLALSAVLAYATLCLLFYQGSWQLIFHPSRVVGTHPAVAYEEIRFNYTETGKAQLVGWWAPAEADAPYKSRTIVLLHDGRGSLADVSSRMEMLHALGVNVFAFDYRGFGQSTELHPSEMSLNQDADAAVAYLTGTRHLPARSIVLYGDGIGAVVAASTASRHPEMAGLILEDISPDALRILSQDARTKILPVRLLTSDRLDIASSLKTLRTPKLFLDHGNSPETVQAYEAADEPRKILELTGDQAANRSAFHAFLDQIAR